MTLRFVDYRTALATKNPHANWYQALDRLRPEAWPHIQPSFSLKPGDTILTVGSCFARNIEQHLAQVGFRVPSLSLGHFGEASLLTKFTPPSISQEISWAARIYRRDDTVSEEDCDAFFYVLRNGSIIDNNLADFHPVSREVALGRRRRVYDIFREAFFADCVILTPGLAEAWFDADRGIFIQKLLTGHHSDISRHLKFAMLDFATCFECLDRAISEIRGINDRAKFLITTSPIPLDHTFTGDDIIIANTHAKSVLRAACGELVAKWDGVDYFPSFESVTLTRDWNVFASDGLHVEIGFIRKIVSRVLDSYCGGTNEAERLFEASASEADIDKARSLLKQAIALAPNVPNYRFAMPSLHMRTKDYDAAIQAYDEAIDLYAASGDTSYPHHLEPDAKLTLRLNIFRRTGDMENLRATLIKILEMRPDNALLHFELAGLLWRAGEIEAAADSFGRAWDLGTYDPLIVGTSLANAWCHLGRSREAIDLLQDMTAEWDSDTRLWTLLGNANLQIQNTEAAFDAFSRAVAADPANEAARYNMTELKKRMALAAPAG